MKNKCLTILARNLRRNQSDAERILWSRLRRSQLNGVKFRRQQPFGDYIVDFISFEKRLIIEIDGGQHIESTKNDSVRTEYLESQEYRVIRFWNTDIMQNIEGVIDEIYITLTFTSPVKGEGNPSIYIVEKPEKGRQEFVE
ncbi:MAG TPA: endonuclease domain-containing protein [Dehalococcoidia bacterium]|nr:endonuclease domain-containing protein [Dehalococcoidia bacterium]